MTDCRNGRIERERRTLALQAVLSRQDNKLKALDMDLLDESESVLDSSPGTKEYRLERDIQMLCEILAEGRGLAERWPGAFQMGPPPF